MTAPAPRPASSPPRSGAGSAGAVMLIAALGMLIAALGAGSLLRLLAGQVLLFASPGLVWATSRAGPGTAMPGIAGRVALALAIVGGCSALFRCCTARVPSIMLLAMILTLLSAVLDPAASRVGAGLVRAGERDVSRTARAARRVLFYEQGASWWWVAAGPAVGHRDAVDPVVGRVRPPMAGADRLLRAGHRIPVDPGQGGTDPHVGGADASDACGRAPNASASTTSCGSTPRRTATRPRSGCPRGRSASSPASRGAARASG